MYIQIQLDCRVCVKYVFKCSSLKNVCTNTIQYSIHWVRETEKKSTFLQMFIGIVKAVRINQLALIFSYCAIIYISELNILIVLKLMQSKQFYFFYICTEKWSSTIADNFFHPVGGWALISDNSIFLDLLKLQSSMLLRSRKKVLVLLIKAHPVLTGQKAEQIFFPSIQCIVSQLAMNIFDAHSTHAHICTGGLFGTQPANEYCFTLSNANVTFTVGSNSRYVYAQCMYVRMYV